MKDRSFAAKAELAFLFVMYTAFGCTSVLFQIGVIGEPCTWDADRLPPGPNQAHIIVIMAGTLGCIFSSVLFWSIHTGRFENVNNDVIALAFAFFRAPLFVLQFAALLGSPVGGKVPDHVCDQATDAYFFALTMTTMLVVLSTIGFLGFLHDKQTEVDAREELETSTLNAPLLNETKA